ncbi:MAG: hypothetical protein EXS64_01585 [Candidatus Latescibacteria bacterium]|nr:hypothetical protein [Candidatus Latescibacterota bacterium]
MGAHLRLGRLDEDRTGCCTALQAGERIFVSGLTAEPGGRSEVQFQRVVARVEKALGGCGGALSDVVRTRVFYTRPQDRSLLCAAHGEVFRAIRPAASLTEVPFLPGGANVLVEAEAVRGSAKGRKALDLDTPEAQEMGCAGAVRVGDDIWVAGITAVGPDGAVIAPGDAVGQAREVVGRIVSLLKGVGARPEDVVGTRAFTPVAYVTADTWRTRLPLMHPGHPTAADITVGAVGAREAGILIEAEAVVGAKEGRKNVNTGRPFEEEHHYSRAVRTGDVVTVAGTTSVQVEESVACPFDAYGQTLATLKWIRWGVEQQGLSFQDVVRTRSYVVGEENVEAVVRGLRETLGETGPAATVVGVPALGRPSILVEIEATAVRGAGGK